ncbi:P-II family nitrogen regulator [Oxalicibacterium faecigallinarum]|uniref:Nitrogen regulatory protein P-II 1 n=1 Tax=Oxalicibacterium faecigallinarum TaxID=573741 RepID=A0A8J3F4G8_9BURK|nr:P-II family nitrogen regulator [Oxalicibacterium faecigallinarum]GGI21363.1 nitrogen regulatory protein P-II 1 [Oxalicibacterium faecigallinarum]
MKEIKAIIRPARLEDVSEALRVMPGFPGMTITQVEGCSSPLRHQPQGHKEELLDYSPKVRIELIVDDQYALSLYDTIKQMSSTNHVGDGIVWMTAVERFDYIWQPGN